MECFPEVKASSPQKKIRECYDKILLTKLFKIMKKNCKSRGGAFPDIFSSKILLTMRITILLLLLSVIQVMGENSYSQNTRLSIDLEDVTIETALDQIENQSEFYFLFNQKLVDVERQVTIHAKDQRIRDILEELFAGEDVEFLVYDRQILLSPTYLAPPIKRTKDQKLPAVTVTGTIIDESGQPMPAVNIREKGSGTGTISGPSGEYSLDVDDPNGTLVFSFIGYRTMEIPIAGKIVINVAMVEDVIGLDAVIKIGYGTARKSDLTGSVTVVDAKLIENSSGASLLQGLEGTTAGLNITSTSFRPGASPGLSIRGIGSLALPSDPLIILDGIPYSENLNSINSTDIESMTVLKDASAASIYGARAANGVILITTKSGKSGKPRITYDATVGMQTINQKLDMLDGPGHIQFLTDWNKYVGNTVGDPRDLLYTNSWDNYDAGVTTDWADLVYRNAMQHKHTVSISGSNEATKYYTSVGIYDQAGIVKGSSFQRYSVLSNISHSVNDWITLKANVSFSQTDAGGVAASSSMVHRLSPYGKVYEENGEYTKFPQYPQVYYTNPFANIDATIDNITRRSRGVFVAEFKPAIIPGLVNKVNYGITSVAHKTGQYYPKSTLTGEQNQGFASIGNNQKLLNTFENILTYDKEFGDHSLNFTGVYSFETSRIEDAYMSASKFLDDASLYHFIESTGNTEGIKITSGLVETAMTSLVGRINYDYSKKYYLTATVRRDGSSVFGKNNRYAIFPSAALSWVISNEDFMKENSALDFIDFMKFRLSYGSNGNMLSPYFTQDNMNIYSMVFGDGTPTVKGLRIGGIGNPDLKWETTNSANIGLDFAMLNNRISGTIEVYKSFSNDLLMTRKVPIMNGYNDIWYNIAKTENNGVDLNLRTINVDKKDFKWTTMMNFSYVKDKIIDLYGDQMDDIGNEWFIGHPLSVWYDWKVIGIWQEGDNIADSPQPSARPGFPIIQDTNEDGAIDELDKVIIDSKLPDWRAGMTNTFSYKNFDLTMVMYAVWGIERDNELLDPGTWDIQKNTNYLNIPYWTPERPNTEYVAPGYDLVRTFKHNFYQNSSFVKIKDVILSYNLPETSLKSMGIQGLRIYIQGSNLQTFSKFIGNDPENGSSYGMYPSARSVKLGLNIQF